MGIHSIEMFLPRAFASLPVGLNNEIQWLKIGHAAMDTPGLWCHSTKHSVAKFVSPPTMATACHFSSCLCMSSAEKQRYKNYICSLTQFTEQLPKKLYQP